jgi:predicted unusual protein kinase regulating ubiquinone biosynthesis (AarF/ABC1/UbiB family)
VGTFHADPHPGNLYLTGDGRVALLDCGSIGRLDRRQRTALQAVLIAVDAQDAAQLRDALRRITTTRRTIDGVLLERALSEVLLQQLGHGAMLGGALFAALIAVLRELGWRSSPSWVGRFAPWPPSSGPSSCSHLTSICSRRPSRTVVRSCRAAAADQPKIGP